MPPRGRPRKFTVGAGRISDNRIAWAETIIGKFIVRQYPPSGDGAKDWKSWLDDPAESEMGDTVRLEIYVAGKAVPVGLNLTTCTVDELKAIRDLLTFAIDLAEPVVTFRDGMAEHAKNQGDDSLARIYRQVPVLVIREGKVRAHGEGVLHGPSDVPVGPGGADGGHGGVRGTGDGLADEEPSNSGPEDLGEAPDESA